MGENDSRLQLEVVYANAGVVHSIALELPPGTTIRQAIEASALLQRCPEIDLAVNKTGVFNKLCALHSEVRDGDRIEIYRPLKVDPKEARRRRADKQKVKQG